MLFQVLSFQFPNVNKVFVVLQFCNCPQFLRECKLMLSFQKLGILRSLHIKNLHVLKWGAGKMYVGDVRRLSKPVASLSRADDRHTPPTFIRQTNGLLIPIKPLVCMQICAEKWPDFFKLSIQFQPFPTHLYDLQYVKRYYIRYCPQVSQVFLKGHWRRRKGLIKSGLLSDLLHMWVIMACQTDIMLLFIL